MTEQISRQEVKLSSDGLKKINLIKKEKKVTSKNISENAGASAQLIDTFFKGKSIRFDDAKKILYSLNINDYKSILDFADLVPLPINY